MQQPIPISERGADVLRTPLLNKGTAFTNEERHALGLHGLLPPHVSSVEEQIKRCYQFFNTKKTPLGKYNYLNALLNRNEHLFYLFVDRHIAEMTPYIYTPTVGEAATHYSQVYATQRGLYLSYPMADRIEEMIDNMPQKEVDIAVVTDGERILGLGDLGLGGMAIPIGKLCLYTLFAGIHPTRTLPIFLDIGTNNSNLLNDDLYLGWRHPRLGGSDYDRFIDRFIKALKKRYPNILLQWEDFGKQNARRLLRRYRNDLLSFNDDIQGTAAVALAGILAALKQTGGSLADQKVVLLGGGSAGIGIADTLTQAMVHQGLSLEEAHSRIFVVDIHGLIHFNTPNVAEEQRPYIKPQGSLKDWKVLNFEHVTLQEVVENAHPSILIGVSAQGCAFTEEIVRAMARTTKRPIIFPLSNPTSKAEAIPQELIEWTDGQALIATGSPFQPATYKGKTYPVSQCNNVYLFPGIGLGALVAKATHLSDTLFLVAAETLAGLSSDTLFPPLTDVRAASHKVALAVALKACKEGIAHCPEHEIPGRLNRLMWKPSYPIYIAARPFA